MNESTLMLSLIREHFDGTEESFRDVCLSVAKKFDKLGKHALAEYIFAYLWPATSFSTFETFYYKGNVVVTKDDVGKEYKYKIISVEERGVYAKILDEKDRIAYYIPYSELTRNYELDMR